MYNYLFFGQWFVSEIDFPGISTIDPTSFNLLKPIRIYYGKTPEKLKNLPTVEKPFSTFNECEFLYRIPEIAHYYIQNGDEICIEPISPNLSEVFIHFYSTALAAVLYQRNLIPFHASGVKINEKQIVLFPAPSRTGKSTTALFLDKSGYPIFTDDTVLLEVIDGKCFATPSYSIIRLWQNTIDENEAIQEADRYELRPGISKFGISIRERFSYDKMELAGLVFLDSNGNKLKIEQLKTKNIFPLLKRNVYRNQWINGMNKQVLQFQLIASISQCVPAFLAQRPKSKPTFEEFAASIEQEIIFKLNGSVE